MIPKLPSMPGEILESFIIPRSLFESILTPFENTSNNHYQPLGEYLVLMSTLQKLADMVDNNSYRDGCNKLTVLMEGKIGEKHISHNFRYA